MKIEKSISTFHPSACVSLEMKQPEAKGIWHGREAHKSHSSLLFCSHARDCMKQANKFPRKSRENFRFLQFSSITRSSRFIILPLVLLYARVLVCAEREASEQVDFELFCFSSLLVSAKRRGGPMEKCSVIYVCFIKG